MGIYVELRDEAGRPVTGLSDPSGGTFDAAGDFDRFLDQHPYDEIPDLPVLQFIDPFGTSVMASGDMARLIGDCDRALPAAKDGPERRGLLRLRVLAEECSRRPATALHWTGD